MNAIAKAHGLSDCWPAIGLVRDAQRRETVFADLAAGIAHDHSVDPTTHQVAPPEWRWYRINPCNCGEHKWHYDDGKQGQRGSFLGSLIVIRRKSGAS